MPADNLFARCRLYGTRAALLTLAAALVAACGETATPADQSAATTQTNNLAEPAGPSKQGLPATAPRPRLSREQLREKAKTDPEGADTQAVEQMSRNELVATAINSAGLLCARVTDLYPSGDDIVAHCVEYRSGTGRVVYRINAEAGSVVRVGE
jgi:hypothetical protein